MDLFQTSHSTARALEPLAMRMRPQTLDAFFGQTHILAPGKLLWRAIRADRFSSLILYGPPGTGKTSLAFVISKETKAHFEAINAVSSNVQELRQVIEKADKRLGLNGQKTILFLDEIHRFNKAQQDVLMPHVEKGNPVLIGATTHNPFFSIVPALLSRSLIFELKALSEEEIKQVIHRALTDQENGLGRYPVQMNDDAINFLASVCDGDARRALNALEIGILTTTPTDAGKILFTKSVAEESIQKKAVVYDDKDAHFDTASAFIKSMRGSDPDAAVYYLAKMLSAGEDPRFIARRILICASEDVGNADPQALILAAAASYAVDYVGMPEARITLAQAVTYISCCPKSNTSYLAVQKATEDVKKGRLLEIPAYLKDASYKGAAKLGRVGYQYAHDGPDHYVSQKYLAEDRQYYEPTSLGYEAVLKAYLETIRARER